uniref:DUF4365 domain-containing protein n=1 Tax=Paracidobacterium acidisoli TaxID=2303751 RepID=A0A372IKU6_9BACT
MRGIIAEAVFVNDVIPGIVESGWQHIKIEGDHPYDVLLRKGALSVRIQIKLQRLEKGVPKLYYPRHYKVGSLHVVEVQKTRTGERATTTTLPGTDTKIVTTEPVTVKTRPYSFGDFDILAVNMHPSSGDWKNFRYTLSSWLLPRRDPDPALIEIFQPVSVLPDEVWTDNLAVCLKWFEAGKKNRILAEVLHQKKAKKDFL